MTRDRSEDKTGSDGAPFAGKDFRGLRDTGERAGASWAIGAPVVRFRNWLAGRLIRLGVRPNMVTTTGFLITSVAAVCLAIGGSHTFDSVEGLQSSWWCLAALASLFCAGACDILDGAVARIGNLGSRFGEILDSTLDRFSDCVLYLGVIVHFAWLGNVTICALAGVAMIQAYSVSYIKARADCLIDAGTAGWWQRPERLFGFLVATLFGHIPAFMWQQATMPVFTVMRRLRHARAAVIADDAGEPPPDPGPLPGIRRYLAPWRHARGSLPYDIAAGVNIGWIIAAPWIWPFFYGRTDPLRTLAEHWLG